MNFKQCERDPCLYIRNKTLISIYVDDCIISAPTTKEIKQLINGLKEIYQLTEQGELKYILGVEIERNRNTKTIQINQTKYIKNIVKRFNMENSNSVNIPYFKAEETTELTNTKEYQSIIGSENYAAVISRPDISFTVNNLARSLYQPTDNNYKAAKKLLRYLNGTLELKLTINGQLQIQAYSDASLGDDEETKRSISGIVIYLGNTPIIWKSNDNQ